MGFTDVYRMMFGWLSSSSGEGETVPGLEYSATGRLHFTAAPAPTTYVAQGRLHYTAPEEDTP